MSLISIVISVYNEQEYLPALFERLNGLQASGPERYEFVFVDDGSSDQSRRIICRLSDVDIPPDTGDFRLMDRRAVEHFGRCCGYSCFVRGLVAWTGFRQAAVLYDRDQRHGGQAKYSLFRLIVRAFDPVVGFSNVPLRIGIFLGLLICILSPAMAAKVFLEKLIWGIPVPGNGRRT